MPDKFQVKRNFDKIFDDAVCDDQTAGELYQHLRNSTWRYAQEGKLGEGAMKIVTLVKDEITGRKVAKATLKGEAKRESSERFLREARICARLEHPNIVPLHDLGVDENGEVYFTMKLLEGISFQELIDEIKNNKSELNLNELLEIFVKICDALAYAHSQQIIHLDLKPENIQISQFGEVMVCDWGLARDLRQKESPTEELIVCESFVTQDGLIRGTPGYMSPEQARGAISESSFQSDIYSLGAILYTILTLERPCTGSVKDVIAQTLSGAFLSPSELCPKRDIPTVLNSICAKAMELNPHERYTKVDQLKADLLSYLRGFVTSVEKASFFIQVKLLIKRNTVLSLVLIMSSIFLISATSAFMFSIKQSELEARNSAQQAKKAEELATKTLLKWQRTNELKMLIASESLPQLITLTRNAVENYEVQKGVDLAKVAVELDQSLQIAHKDLGYLQASLFEFEASIQSYLQGGIDAQNNHIKASEMCLERFKGRKDLSFDEIIWIVRTYADHRLYNMINEFTFSPKLHFFTLEQRRQYAKETIKLQNSQLKEFKFVGDKVEFDARKISFDINALYKTQITELNLKDAKLRKNIVAIRGLPLRKIVLPKIDPNRQIPYLKTCKTLEEVHLPKKSTDQSLLLDLPKSIKIIFY